MDTTPTRPAVPVSVGARVRSWVAWFGAGRLAAAALSVVAVSVGALWLLRAPTPTTESKLPYAGSSRSVSPSQSGAAAPGSSSENAAGGNAADGAASTGAAVSTTTSPPIVVHVAGAVVAPGVYRLAADARVIDALTAAGGLTPDADSNVVNLAAHVSDGQRVYAPRVGETPPVVVTGSGASSSAGSTAGGSSGAATPAGPIDINAATAEQLDALPGVGPATAAAIIAFRDQHGPFSSIEQLGDVRGIGPAKLDALRGLVTV